MRNGAMILRPFAIAALAALVTGRGAAAQQSASPRLSGPTLALVESVDAGAAAQLPRAERGEPVVRELPSSDRDEVALVGLITVDAPRDFYVSLGSTNALVSPPTRTELGAFGSTPAAADLGAFTLSRGDLRDLRDCRPLHCALKLSSGAMAALSQVASSGRADAPRADSAMRDWIAGVVRAYAAAGDSALPIYDDTRMGERAHDGAVRLLAEDSAVLGPAPQLSAYLAGAPDNTVPGVATRFYWSVDRPPGLAPILSATQLSTYASADPTAPSYVVSKQIYANHYFDARLDVAALTDGTSASPSTLVLLVRRVRFDHLASGGLFDLRGRVVRKLRDALRDEMTRTKQLVEQAYRERATP